MEHLNPIEKPWPMDGRPPDPGQGINEPQKLTRENWLRVSFWLDPVSRLVVKFALNYNNDEDAGQEAVILIN